MMLDGDLFDFLEHTADAAFAVTDGGEICSWNASAVALFGFSREEAVARKDKILEALERLKGAA